MIGSARGCVDEAAITVYTVESARLMSRLNSRLERRLQALACACGVSAHARCPIGAMWQHPTKVQNILKPVKKKRRRRTRHDPRPRHIRYPCTMPCSARNGTRGRGGGAGAAGGAMQERRSQVVPTPPPLTVCEKHGRTHRVRVVSVARQHAPCRCGLNPAQLRSQFNSGFRPGA